jgi:hypothetical protein
VARDAEEPGYALRIIASSAPATIPVRLRERLSQQVHGNLRQEHSPDEERKYRGRVLAVQALHLVVAQSQLDLVPAAITALRYRGTRHELCDERTGTRPAKVRAELFYRVDSDAADAVGVSLVATRWPSSVACGGHLAVGRSSGNDRVVRIVALLALAGAVTAAATARPAVSMVSLPSGVDFYSVEPLGDRLLLSGDDSEGLDCDWLVVNRDLRVESSLLRASCERPPIAATPVVPVAFSLPQGNELAVRIARPNAKPSRVTYGPVVMTCEDASDTRPQWVYGAGMLWLYDVATLRAGARTPRAEVVQVSMATGRVVRTVPMPQIYRPLLAADADGLWLAGSVETGLGIAPTYHLAPGASAPRLVHRGGYAAYWLLAAGHEVWEDIASQKHSAVTQEIWRFDGPGAIAHALASANRLVAGTPAVKPGSAALWLVGSLPYRRDVNGCVGAQIVSINAQTGRQTVTRTLTLPGNPCLGIPYTPEAQAFTSGALYFLIPALTPGTTLLYRVQP